MTLNVDGTKLIASGTQMVVDGTVDFITGGKGSGIPDYLMASNLVVGSGGVVESGSGLNLNVMSLNNAGTISSNGLLNVDVRGSNAIVNSGLMESANGSVTIDVPKSQNLVFNGAGGTVQALNGAINIGSSNMVSTANTTLSGGNYLSQQLNIYAGNNISLNVEQVSGVLNETAGNGINNIVATPNLNLGNLIAQGDPLTYNLTGNVTLSSATDSGQPFGVAAAGNIIGSTTTIDTSNSSGNGGDITMIAGATLTLNGDGSVTASIQWYRWIYSIGYLKCISCKSSW